jgi:hypothetical protein
MIDLAETTTVPLPLEKNFDLLKNERSFQGNTVQDLLLLNNQLYFGQADREVGKTLSAFSVTDQAELTAEKAEMVFDDMCRPVVAGQKLMVAQHDKLKNTTHIQAFNMQLEKQQSIFAGHAIIRSFAVLANGNMIVCAGNLSRTPQAVIGTDNREATAKWWQEVQELSAYSIFLVSPSFEVIEPLVPAVPVKHARDIEGHLRNSWQLRADQSGKRVLAYSEVSKEILVFDHNGKIIAQLSHPGEGNPYDGKFGSFQSDYQQEVTFVGDHVMVSDPASRKLWLLNLKSQVVAAYQQPYKVLEFAVSDEHVYFYGFDGDGVQHLNRAKRSQFDAQ